MPTVLLFTLFQNTIPIKMAICLGDHSSVNAFYSGIVVLRTTHGILNLHAIYVPQFRMSLLSVGQLSFCKLSVHLSEL
jgi:hypothetical protein